MTKTKKALVACALLAAMVPCTFAAAACSGGSASDSEYANVVSRPCVQQASEYTFAWPALEGVTGYVVRIDGGTPKAVGGNSFTETVSGGKVEMYSYSVDTSDMETGEHTVQFAAYTYDKKEGDVIGEWGELFTIEVGGLKDQYKVEKLAAPRVVRNGLSFSLNSYGNSAGYVVSIDDKISGIGDVYGYDLDLTKLEAGTHKVKFAAYTFNDVEGNVIGEWSEDFVVEAAPVGQPVASVEVDELNELVHVMIPDHPETVTQLEFNFGNNVTATYTPVERLNRNNSIDFEDLEFTGTLEQNKVYNLTVVAVDKFGSSEASNPTLFIYDKEVYTVEAPKASNLESMNNGGALFSTKHAPYKTVFTLMVSSKEYTFRYYGNAVYDTDLKAYRFTLADILNTLDEDVAEEIQSDIFGSTTVNVALKINYEDGHNQSTTYSNDVNIYENIDTNFDEIIEYYITSGVTASFVEDVEGGYLKNGLKLDLSELPAYILNKTSFKVTFKDATGRENTVTGANDKVLNNTVVYEYSNLMKYGVSSVKVVATYAASASSSKSYTIATKEYNYEEPEISNIRISGNTLSWSTSNSNYDGFTVNVLSSTGTVAKSFDVENRTWKISEYKDSNNFRVQIIPKKSDLVGTGSKAFTIERGAVSTSTSYFRQTESDVQLTTYSSEGFPIKVNLVSYDEEGEVISTTTLASNITKSSFGSNNYYSVISKSNLSNNYSAYFNGTGVKKTVLQVVYQSNNYQFADSLPYEREVNLNQMEYEQVDNQKIKLSENKNNLRVSVYDSYSGDYVYNTIPSTYFDTNNNFDVLKYLDDNSKSSLTLYANGTFNSTGATTLYAPVTISPTRAATTYASYDNSLNEVTFTNSSITHHAEFEWYLTANGETTKLKSGTTKTGKLDMGNLNLVLGEYDLYVRTLGNGTYMNGQYNKYDFAQYYITSNDLTFSGDAYTRQTTITMPYMPNARISVTAYKSGYSSLYTLRSTSTPENDYSGSTTKSKVSLSTQSASSSYLSDNAISYMYVNISAYSGFCHTPSDGKITLYSVYTHAVYNRYNSNYDLYYSTSSSLSQAARPDVISGSTLYVRDSAYYYSNNIYKHDFKSGRTVTVQSNSSNIYTGSNTMYQSGSSYYHTSDSYSSVNVVMNYNDTVLTVLNRVLTLNTGYNYYSDSSRTTRLSSTTTADNISYVYVG